MLFLVIFASAVAAVMAGGVQEVAVTQDTLGNYKLKYAIDGIARVEHGDGFGNVNGGFSYIDPHGILRKTEFTAGVHGYHAIGTDIPVPVLDTPEVAHAKAQHLSVLRASHLAAGSGEHLLAPIPLARSIAAPVAPLAPIAPIARFEHVAPAPVHLAPAHHIAGLSHVGIPETPEVLAARAQHFAAHAASAHHIPAFSHVGIAETPEVLAARAEHFAAHATALKTHFHH